MVYISIKKHLFILFVLNQVLNANSADYLPETLLDTNYAVDEFNLIWKIGDFSKIYNNVRAEFPSEKSLTKWALTLISKEEIRLYQSGYEKPVYVDLEYSLITRYKTFEGKTHELVGLYDRVTLLRFEMSEKLNDTKPIEFENDVFEFHCKMKITGPALTKIVYTTMEG